MMSGQVAKLSGMDPLHISPKTENPHLMRVNLIIVRRPPEHRLTYGCIA